MYEKSRKQPKIPLKMLENKDISFKSQNLFQICKFKQLIISKLSLFAFYPLKVFNKLLTIVEADVLT